MNSMQTMISSASFQSIKHISSALKNTPFIARHFLRMASLKKLPIARYCYVFAPSHSQKLSHSKWGILEPERYIAAVLITFLAISPYSLAAELQLDPETGLIIDKGYKTVNAYCIGCHKGRMIREHGATREDWVRTVRKMQTLGRWTFTPSTESLVVDYLSKHYPDNLVTNK